MDKGKPEQHPGMGKSLCGRAELLLALADGAPADLLPEMANLLGFTALTAKPQADIDATAHSQGKTQLTKNRETTEEPEKTLAIPFWRVTACQYHPISLLEEEETSTAHTIPAPPEYYPEERAAPPTTTPLSAWSVLLPYLRRAAMHAVPSSRPDIKATVRRLSRGELLPTLPRKPHRAWGMQAHVILDRSRRLIPYWQDQLDILTRIQQLFPVDSVTSALYWDGMDAPVFDDEQLQSYRLPDPGALVLVLGDLGFFSTDKRTRQVWRSLGERLQERGCRPLALLPAGKQMSDPVWQTLAWECHTPPRLTAFAKAFPNKKPVEQLLTLLAPAIRIEPGLLRDVRRLLGVDAAVEAFFWQHPDLTGISSIAATLEQTRVKVLRARFDSLDDKCREILLERVCAWRDGLPAEIWIEECYASSPHTRKLLEKHPDLNKYIRRAKQFYAYLGETLSTESADADARAWVRRMEPRIAIRTEQPEALQRDLDRLHHIAHADETKGTVPPGYDPAHIPSRSPLRTWQLYHQNESLLLLEAPHPGAVEKQRGASWLGQLQSRNGQISLDDEPLFWQEVAPPWASAWGKDEYGLWVEFVLKTPSPSMGEGRGEGEVKQRLRWIPAGSFLMGSSESEPERWDSEGPQHQVTLTEGFWLFDSAVTQALWEAVMGDNPSKFKGPDRPMENVSWDDTKDFIGKLNGILPGLELTLPSEAQWEYACRAGTQTPFYFGDNITPEQVNYDGNNPYTDGEKGVWREETVPVKSLPPNAWGLYEMHGNVWEWCQDYWGGYSKDAQLNSTGPVGGDSRVRRGGSWLGYARLVRAACRRYGTPVYRYGDQGLRCARVQVGARPVAAEPVASVESGPKESRTQRSEQGVAALLRWREGAADRLALPSTPDFILRSDTGQLEVSNLYKPDWAKNTGRDRYGLWAEFVLEAPPFHKGSEPQKVRQRLRWIPPGRFLMGSLESEPERWKEGESPQHEVTLTQGFWLFDTAVTQALWEAVMGENPSHFQGTDRPVENVRWNETKAFIDKLNSILPGLELTLPSEAQWEYACRAGTQTPFYFGDNITPEQVNYDGNNPYTDGEKGVWREETVPVKSLPPNAWGLYEIHGNVWEWCQDYWGGYSKDAQLNPTGPVGGDSRVIRGGSWNDDARGVRAAYRYGGSPGYRAGYQGFRCARVQGEPGQAGKQVYLVKQDSPLSSKEAEATGEETGGLLQRVSQFFKRKTS
ncbi:formylglycine-generating enzyme family protein [Candidatus Venteria ishoeyi]|uniref:formylglycine-generating enzyme family protein n=1 Tax=Candidatus Venteria ishoeyi TaxID=1899563 RepID=UPI0025A534BE|nr:formylglycine-generating enzyme family protein [Candidatus Venteria ishoeyi]MDM8548256.1 formylglycine-generating enzyme family protein [Candidatus Venteria ishoeyi]